MNISEKLNSLPSSAILRIFKIRNPDLVSDTTGRKEEEREEEQTGNCKAFHVNE